MRRCAGAVLSTNTPVEGGIPRCVEDWLSQASHVTQSALGLPSNDLEATMTRCHKSRFSVDQVFGRRLYSYYVYPSPRLFYIATVGPHLGKHNCRTCFFILYNSKRVGSTAPRQPFAKQINTSVLLYGMSHHRSHAHVCLGWTKTSVKKPEINRPPVHVKHSFLEGGRTLLRSLIPHLRSSSLLDWKGF